VRRALLLAAAVWSGCGYVGEPLPPLLNIPMRVSDLTARQTGARLRIEFSVPPLNTEGEVMKRPVRVEVKAGSFQGEPFSADAWAATATSLSAPPLEQGRIAFDVPVAPWAGQTVIFGVILTADNGRQSGWSNFVTLNVLPPLQQPRELAASTTERGVRLTWKGEAASYRIYRRGPNEKDFAVVTDAAGAEWIDPAPEYERRYAYRVQAVSGEAVSDISDPVEIVPVDTFPPAAPQGLIAIGGPGGIDLAW
jgi:hypothetical protein